MPLSFDRGIVILMTDDRPSLTLTSVTIAAPAPRELAAFYAALLSAEVAVSEPPGAEEPEDAGWAQVKAGAITLNFEFEQQWTSPVWPARLGAQLATQHLDIFVQDLEASTRWAVSQGARLALSQPQTDVRVLIDPAGHPFCLFE